MSEKYVPPEYKEDAFNCPFLMAILTKINMKNMDYTNYKKRTGQMILMEHKRKMGERK